MLCNLRLADGCVLQLNGTILSETGQHTTDRRWTDLNSNDRAMWQETITRTGLNDEQL